MRGGGRDRSRDRDRGRGTGTGKVREGEPTRREGRPRISGVHYAQKNTHRTAVEGQTRAMRAHLRVLDESSVGRGFGGDWAQDGGMPGLVSVGSTFEHVVRIIILIRTGEYHGGNDAVGVGGFKGAAAHDFVLPHALARLPLLFRNDRTADVCKWGRKLEKDDGRFVRF